MIRVISIGRFVVKVEMSEIFIPETLILNFNTRYLVDFALDVPTEEQTESKSFNSYFKIYKSWLSVNTRYVQFGVITKPFFYIHNKKKMIRQVARNSVTHNQQKIQKREHNYGTNK